MNIEKNAKKLISPFILLCLMVQAGTAVRLFCLESIFSFLPETVNVACDPVLYPFTSYAMYSRAKYEGAVTSKRIFMAKLIDESEIVVNHKSLGVTDYMFKKYSGNIGKDEQKLSKFIELYDANNDKKIRELFVKVDTYKITRSGIIKTNSPTINTILSAQKSGEK